jgi:cyclopropane fatty-acyl-phospholipid synthase-like methyltransferase
MKHADPARDYRALVRDGYDRISAEFNRTRALEPAGELAPLLSMLAPHSTVLDLGCGTGVPIARALSVASHRVLGVDISRAQLALARRQVPEAQLVRADLSRCHFRPVSFDAVVIFYAMFHTPLSEHPLIIRRISEWLRPGGCVLATLSPSREAGYTEDFFGTEMYWSNLSLAEYRELLLSCGFDIISEAVVGHGYSDASARPETHPLVLARKLP